MSISGMTAGDYATLLIIQGTTASRIDNWITGSKFPSATFSFTSTQNKADIFGVYYNGTNYYWTYNLNY